MIKTGIDNVRCFGIAAGIRADGSAVNEALSCVVSFKSSNDKFHQVYVNGRLSGVTNSAGQRKITVPLHLLKKRASVVDVVAVEAGEKQTDFSSQLTSVLTGRLKVSIPEVAGLPYDGVAEVYSNGGSGDIDFGEAISNEPIRLFSSRNEKGGFGLNKFGIVDFGQSEYEFDGGVIEWESDELDSGKYKIGVKITDGSGNSVTVSNETEITIVSEAIPAKELAVESYDKTQDELILNVNL